MSLLVVVLKCLKYKVDKAWVDGFVLMQSLNNALLSCYSVLFCILPLQVLNVVKYLVFLA